MWGISTILITFNEENNIGRCLESVKPFSDEVIVVDSGSTDRTVDIAREHGARVFQRDWPGYGPQKQYALEQATSPWVFSIDADEVVSPELCSAIQSLDPYRYGYQVARPVWYLGQWIRHSGWYPGWVTRLFRRESGAFTDEIVHESVRVSGSVGRLRGDLLHYSYRDISHHIDKMNGLSTLAAEKMYRRGRRAGFLSLLVVPWLQFNKTYFLRRGFLDGRAGVVVSLLHSVYVFLKYAKLRELQMHPEGGKR